MTIEDKIEDYIVRRQAELIVVVAGNIVKVLKPDVEPDKVDKIVEDMITSVRQRVCGTHSVLERSTPPSQASTRKCKPSA